jgi:hypothetical protein
MIFVSKCFLSVLAFGDVDGNTQHALGFTTGPVRKFPLRR